MMYETIIIGAGPAGQQAGLFLGRAKIKTLVIGIPEKSDLSYGKIIGNYFGVSDGPTGLTLLRNGIEHLKKFEVEILEEEVIDLEKPGDTLTVTTNTLKKFEAKSVIITTGQQLPTAGIRGEKDFLGKGVHTCVACDGPLMKNKKVAVVGHGSHAAEEAIELAAYTSQITIYSQGQTWEISQPLIKKIQTLKIQMSDKRITSIEGKMLVERITFKDKTAEAIDGVFLAVGTAGGVTFAYKLGLEQDKGYIKIDRDGKTSVPGVWAAGGVTGGNQQIAKSAGEGCNAAVSIIRTLKGLENYKDQT